MKHISILAKLFAGVLFILVGFTSCKVRERLVYLHNPNTDTIQQVKNTYSPILRVDDKLSILVGGADQEALAPFQFYSTSSSNNNGQTLQLLEGISYLVDINGNINFPVLGFVHLAGKTRLEAVTFLQEQLSQYVDNPVVNIEIKNFKYTVLGQVKSPGIHLVSTERMTILEAIGKAGDLQITGLRNNVLLIREQNGQRIEYRLDLTNKSIYNSPAFYICQNDVIYVEPNFSANFQGTNFQTYTQLGTTLVSIFLSMFTLITLTK
jgi:polysaccharide export outer membrane protein